MSDKKASDKKASEHKTSDKLLPCPFCGGEAELYSYEAERVIYDSDTLGYVDTEYFTKYGVSCTGCNCLMAEYKSEEQAIAAWNTRKPMGRILERLEELRMAEYDDSDEEPKYEDGEDIFDDGVSSGKFIAYRNAIEIIKEEMETNAD